MITLKHGDLFDVLPTLDADSIDACVTDPPYEIGFMGRAWDSSGVAFRPETWREVYRVLKPGAHLVAFGATRGYHRMAVAIEDAGFEVRDSLAWLYGSGFPKSRNLGDGKGTALKPAFEPVVVAWKPFKGTITACHALHGTAALNVDACRIETSDNLNGGGYSNGDPESMWSAGNGGGLRRQPGRLVQPLGRWPANVVIDEHAAAAIDEQSGHMVARASMRGAGPAAGSIHGSRGDASFDSMRGHNDSGGASRFYYCAKASRRERDIGLQARGNVHPTVKPVALMRWLVRLVTPLDGLVLDPFMGSGSTGVACQLERRRFIGVEREADYLEIARRRIAAVEQGEEREAA